MLIYFAVIVLGVCTTEDSFQNFTRNLSIGSFLGFGFQELIQDLKKDVEINKFTLRFTIILSDKLLNSPEMIMGKEKYPMINFNRKSLIYVELVFNVMGITRLRRDLSNKTINVQDMASFKLSEFFEDQDIMRKEIGYAEKDLVAHVKDNKLLFDDIKIKDQLFKFSITNVNTDFEKKNNDRLGYSKEGGSFVYYFEMEKGEKFDEYLLKSDILIENYKFLESIIANTNEIEKEEHIKHIKILLVLSIVFLCVLVTVATISIIYWVKNKKSNYVYLGEGL